jgi:hypothetical protein
MFDQFATTFVTGLFDREALTLVQASEINQPALFDGEIQRCIMFSFVRVTEQIRARHNYLGSRGANTMSTHIIVSRTHCSFSLSWLCFCAHIVRITLQVA